jgi:acetyl esterase
MSYSSSSSRAKGRAGSLPGPADAAELEAASARLDVRGGLGRLRESWQGLRGVTLADSVLRTLATAGRYAPVAWPQRHQVEVIRDIPYTDSGLAEHSLDIYRPVVRPGPWPIIVYVHGGGFSLLSKETHWVMALSFARLGFIVFNISYRLAPRHPYPAALDDTCAAYLWIAEHAPRYGGDLDRLAVAGESAGANLVTALSVATSYRRPEPFARRVYEQGVRPRVAIPACGILQVSDAERFSRRRRLPGWVDTVLTNVSGAYLRGVTPGEHDLADPLLILESGEPPDRSLPAFFAPVGTRDPLLDDTRRLERALGRLGATCQARYYDKEVHAFHAMVWRESARRCWSETSAFLARHLAPDAVGSRLAGAGAPPRR